MRIYSTFRWFYNLVDTFRHFFDSIERFFFWGWNMRHSYDWDYGYLYKMIYLKMKRMEKDFDECKYSVKWTDSNAMHQFKVAKGCMQRMCEKDYCEDEYDHYFKEYPSIIVDSTFTHPKGSDNKRFMRIVRREEYLRQQDIKMFADIFIKHSRKWWT